jgi:hypothetical protein
VVTVISLHPMYPVLTRQSSQICLACCVLRYKGRTSHVQSDSDSTLSLWMLRSCCNVRVLHQNIGDYSQHDLHFLVNPETSTQ